MDSYNILKDKGYMKDIELGTVLLSVVHVLEMTGEITSKDKEDCFRCCVEIGHRKIYTKQGYNTNSESFDFMCPLDETTINFVKKKLLSGGKINISLGRSFIEAIKQL